MSLKDLQFRRVRTGKSLTISGYLNEWASDPRLNANSAGRLLRAIGNPEIVDTSKDERLGRIYDNRTIYRYAPFFEFYGIEEVVERIVRFVKHAADGNEQARQILYLFGPVGSGKSTLVELLMRLGQQEPMWALGYQPESDEKSIELSPLYESPLGLFGGDVFGTTLEERFKIPRSRTRAPMSQWAAQRLEQAGGEYDRFKAFEVMPSLALGIGVARVEPGDKQTSDVRALIGEDAEGKWESYRYTGGLNRTTQGIAEFVEMFKSDPRRLHPLLTCTQDEKYAGDGTIGVLPYGGLLLAHSNEEDWNAFRKANTTTNSNGSLIDRIVAIPVPYCLRTTEERLLLERQKRRSGLADLPTVAGSLDVLAQFVVRTRIDAEFRSARVRLYDGLPLRLEDDVGKNRGFEKDKFASVVASLRGTGSNREGMGGATTRFALKLLPEIADTYPGDRGFDPVTVFEVLARESSISDLKTVGGKPAREILESEILPICVDLVSRLINRAYFEDYEGLARKKFERYLQLLEKWVDGEDFKDPDTDSLLDTSSISTELAKLETGIHIPSSGKMSSKADDLQEFRRNVFKRVQRFRLKSDDDALPWLALDHDLWEKYERNLFEKPDVVVKRIKRDKRDNAKDQKEHDDFMLRLVARGTTEGQSRRLVDWYVAKLEAAATKVR